VVLLTFVCVVLCDVGDGGGIGVHGGLSNLGGGSWWEVEGGVVRFDGGERWYGVWFFGGDFVELVVE
jgi:hypothetical protein